MSDLKLDSTGDLELVGGKLELLSTEAELATQRTRIRLLTYRGEWFLNTLIGIPYFERVLIKTSNKTPIDLLFRGAILEDPAIVSIQEFESSLAGGVYSLKFKAVSRSGELVNFLTTINQ